MAMPIAKSSPMLLVPLPSGAVANMSGVLRVVRGRVRQTPEPQGPGLGVGFRDFVVGGCGLFLRGVFLCLMCLAEPSV